MAAPLVFITDCNEIRGIRAQLRRGRDEGAVLNEFNGRGNRREKNDNTVYTIRQRIKQLINKDRMMIF